MVKDHLTLMHGLRDYASPKARLTRMIKSGDVIQVHDKAIFTATSLAAESLSVSMPIDPTVTDDLPAGASFQLIYNIGGIVVTLTLQES